MTAESSADDDDDDDDAVLDYRKTPLNACSIETFCWRNGGGGGGDGNDSGGGGDDDDDDDDDDDSDENGTRAAYHVPLCLGCYELNERTGRREGRLDIYAVPVPVVVRDRDDDEDDEEHHDRSPPRIGSSSSSFGEVPPLTVLGGDDDADAPGVLDGKWSNHHHHHRDGRNGRFFRAWYATAHANGEVRVHEVRSGSGDESGGGDDDDSAVAAATIRSDGNPFEATLAGTTAASETGGALCLALAWEDPLYSTSGGGCGRGDLLDTRIVSSYSDGRAAVHRVRQKKQQQRPPSLSAEYDDDDDDIAATTTNTNTNTTTNALELELELEHRWMSHEIFGGCPAEVWCSCFVDNDTVVTGGDDGTWKIWDLRAPLSRPVHVGRDDFEAGVTVASPHPRVGVGVVDHRRILALGSYDETVAIFDLRALTSGTRRPRALRKTGSLGGGIWRCKWHPSSSSSSSAGDDRMLIAAMHGGCVVGEFDLNRGGDGDGDDDDDGFRVRARFESHRSMAYGIDWLPSTTTAAVDGRGRGRRRRGGEGAVVDDVDVAASCSFYDKAMYLWSARSR